jgi:hypothetical protein
MNIRLQLHKLGAATAGAAMLWAVAVTQSSVAAASPVTIGIVQGTFYTNPANSGSFDRSVLTSLPAFTQQFPVIGFNPLIGTVTCSNVTGADVNAYSRPITDVVPKPDGTCSLVPAMANGIQAGIGTLFNFQAVFTADLNVASAGQVTLNVASDDGFVLGIGPQGANQPLRVSGTMVNPPPSGTSFVKGYPVMGALNQGTAPSPNDITVNFPVAGTYPLELDYTECCDGLLSLMLTFNGTIVPPAPPSTHTTAMTYTGDLSADFNDPAHLSATLQDTSVSPAVPVSNEAVTLNLGAQSCTGTTDVTGVAACTLKPNGAARNYSASASFAGDATFQASSASAPFLVTLEEDSLTYIGAVNMANGNSAMLSGTLPEDGTTPVTGRSIVFTLGSGASGQNCTGTTNSAGTAACTINIAQPLGPGNIAANFASDGFYRSASAAASALVYENLPSGAFAIGDNNASLGSPVNFWGARWAAGNSLSGGLAPSSFKGFAESLSVTPATCGSTWSTDTGNSSGPPATVPSYLAVLVTSSVSQSGSLVSGTVSEIVVVSTNPGYLNDPGDPGFGTVVAILCRS